MIIFLIGFMLAVLLPLFISSWRVVFLGLGLQGLSIALLYWYQRQEWQLVLSFQFMDLVILRFLLVPILLFLLIKKFRRNLEFDLIPPNFVTWIIVIGLFIMAFTFGHHLYADDFVLTLQTGALTSALLVGLFILSVQTDTLGQMIGLLYIESGISLFETMGHKEPWFIQLSISLIFLWLLFLFSRFLGKFHQLQENPGDEAKTLEAEVL